MLLCGIARAQYNTEFMNYSYTGRSVSANLDFDAGSNGFTNSLTNKLLFGGYIDNDLKKEASKGLKFKNNFGLALNYGLTAFVKGNAKYDFIVGFKEQQILNATYTRDFFNLMFYGNAMYMGQTANLSNCNVNALSFQEVKFGAILHKFDSVAKIGISISFLKGQQLFYIKTNRNSSLYTSADGSEIFFNSNFNMAVSDPNKKTLGSFNGIGAAADIYFETPYKNKWGKKNVLIVNANNIGFIHWQNNSVQYSSDSTFKYTGYRINTLSDLKDSTLDKLKSDSLLRRLANKRKENFNVNIPANLLIINKIYLNEAFALSAGFRYIFNANYRPYIFLEPEYHYKKVYFVFHAGYGGYALLNVGASLVWNCKSIFLKAGSNGLQGYLFPKIGYGQGLFFSVAKKF